MNRDKKITSPVHDLLDKACTAPNGGISLQSWGNFYSLSFAGFTTLGHSWTLDKGVFAGLRQAIDWPLVKDECWVFPALWCT
jgi:hypothetical protein